MGFFKSLLGIFQDQDFEAMEVRSFMEPVVFNGVGLGGKIGSFIRFSRFLGIFDMELPDRTI